MNHQEGMEDFMEMAPEMMEEMPESCPECNGTGMVMKPNDSMHPCSHCASERMRGNMHKGMMDTKYTSIMPELKPRG